MLFVTRNPPYFCVGMNCDNSIKSIYAYPWLCTVIAFLSMSMGIVGKPIAA